MTLVRMIAALYWYVGMPLLLGMTWNKIKEEQKPLVSKTFVEGYLIWFAIFFAGTFGEYRLYYKFSYWKMTRMWALGIAVLTVVCLLFLNKTFVERIRERIRNVKEAFANKEALKRYQYTILVVIGVLFSVLFVNPSINDEVVERGSILVND